MARYVDAAKSGNTTAFAQLYSMVYQSMYNMAVYNLNNREDAQDAVSEAVTDAFVQIKTLKDPLAFRSWIVRILYAKIKRKQKSYVMEKGFVPIADQVVDTDTIELRSLLSTVEFEERRIVTLSVIFGYTSEEISKITGIKAATVRSKLARTLALLRRNMER